MRWLRFLVALALSLVATSASAQQPLIEPGREREVLALLAPHQLGSEVAEGHRLWNVAVASTHIEVQVRGPRGDQRAVRLLHPLAAPTAAEKTQSFAVERNPDVPQAVTDALIAAVRTNDRGDFWEKPRHVEATPISGRRLVSWLVAAFALGWSVLASFRAARAAKRSTWRKLTFPAAIVLAATIAALWIPERLPVHEHNSFLARSDCAFDPQCDEDPRGPAWLPPTFHVYGALLRPFPQRLPTLGLVSLALSLVSLVLLYSLLERLLAHFDRAESARRVGCFAIAFLALQPAWLRVAVGDTFWPYSVCCLLAAGHALLSALRTQKLGAALAASAWLALAALGNTVLLGLVPLALIAPLSWRRTPGRWARWRVLTALAPFVAFVSPYLVASYQKAFVGSSAKLAPAGVGDLFARVAAEFYVYTFDYRISPAALAVFSVCAVFALRSAWRPMLPFAYAYAVTAPFLCLWAGHPLHNSYPVGFVNGFPTLYPLSVLSAFGADWLVSRASPRLSRWAPAIAIALPIASLPFAYEGIAFLTRDRVLERELSAISRVLEQLPAHDVLVEGPDLQWAAQGAPTIGDPIEVAFPRGEYAYVRRRRGLEPAPVIPSDRLGMDGIPRPGARVLVYVGSKLRSFLRSEIDAGAVPEQLERQALVDLRHRFTLVPVHEFEIATDQHPAVNMRLGADRVPGVRLGFYWLVPRDSGTPR